MNENTDWVVDLAHRIKKEIVMFAADDPNLHEFADVLHRNIHVERIQALITAYCPFLQSEK
jgi:hypothetical protein